MSTEKIESKKIALNQKINKLKEQEAKLKEAERKSRNKKIFELGGLVEKAKLDHLNSNQLYGALLQIKRQADNPSMLKEWEHIGGAAFNKDSKEKGEAIIVTFADKPSLETRKQLREFGLKWNSFREEWQGICHVENIESLVKEHNGTIDFAKKERLAEC